MVKIYNKFILKITDIINEFGFSSLYNLCFFITNLFIFLNYYLG